MPCNCKGGYGLKGGMRPIKPKDQSKTTTEKKEDKKQ